MGGVAPSPAVDCAWSVCLCPGLLVSAATTTQVSELRSQIWDLRRQVKSHRDGAARTAEELQAAVAQLGRERARCTAVTDDLAANNAMLVELCQRNAELEQALSEAQSRIATMQSASDGALRVTCCRPGVTRLRCTWCNVAPLYLLRAPACLSVCALRSVERSGRGSSTRH